MNTLFDHIPIVGLILGICVLMRYPYIGAGLMLAAACLQVQQYALAAGCLVIGALMHVVMAKHIKPRRGAVGPSRDSQRRKRRELAERERLKQAQQQEEERLEHAAARQEQETTAQEVEPQLIEQEQYQTLQEMQQEGGEDGEKT